MVQQMKTKIVKPTFRGPSEDLDNNGGDEGDETMG